LAKAFRSYRFNPQLYAAFKIVTKNSGYSITDALEKFMQTCIEANKLVYAEKPTFEAEASVLSDWLAKGKHFYRDENGTELNVQGRLINLLPSVTDPVLKNQIKFTLKNSVISQV
jgi:hypothetical protein